MLVLLIANKNYSSWSLRAWLALRAGGISFEEQVVPLASDAFAAAHEGRLSARKLPLLLDDGEAIWDSLAIVEHVAERYPDAPVWPSDRGARATARAVSAEMHSGFSALRRRLPMNLWRPPEPRSYDEAVARNIARICDIWRGARQRFGGEGPFLFGRFSAADAFYAPVAARFRTYEVPLDAECAAYVEAVHAHPDIIAWRAAALQEPWVVSEDEVDWPIVKRDPL